jgi:alanine racemase
MTSYLVSKIISIVDGKEFSVSCHDNIEIRFLSFDSRTILSGNETLFFALKGVQKDGHLFISDAYKKDVRVFVVEQVPDNYSVFAGAIFIVVEDTVKALQRLASFHRKKFSFPVVGITGSNGKTIVKEWLADLLREDYNIVRSPRSYNSQIGIPLSVWLMEDHHNLALIEAGISKPGEMDASEVIINPDYGIFTHIGQAHIENFESKKQLVKEKMKLFKRSSMLVYCKDFQVLKEVVGETEFSPQIKLFSWSEKQSDADLYIESKEITNGNTFLKGLFCGDSVTLILPFTDNAHVENGIHCWSFMLALGLKPGTFEDLFMELSKVPMRLEMKDAVNGCVVINDSYNSDIGSLVNALDFLANQSRNSNKTSTVILSDIFETGQSPEDLYKQMAELVRLRNVDRIIGIGKEISKYSSFFTPDKKQFFSSTEDFLNFQKEWVFNDEVILLKGARVFHLDRISERLQKKTHQTLMEVDLNAMVHNLDIYKRKINPGTKVMAMVKAFSYGAGAIEIAKVLQFHRIDYLAVAIADEGIELRRLGIDVPIIVMNPEQHSFDAMIEDGLEPNIYRKELLVGFDNSLRRNAVRNFPVHIKIDTGMKRLGFDSQEELSEVVGFVKKCDTIFIRSVFSHLAVSEDEANDDFTIEQFRKFETLSSVIIKEFDYKILRHILNSAGIERFPEKQYEMVRLGIGLYGVSDTCNDELINVATLKTVVSQIRDLLPGETVGYGRRGRVERVSRIAVLPIGYADGLDRRLGNGNGNVLLNNKKVPFVGNICMDMCMVDITNIDAKEGDSVIVFGKGLSVQEVAEAQGTIPYEILTSVGQRVKRVYFTD